MCRKIIISNIDNPMYNLAIEEYLIEKNQECLYLWQNKDTVVIGRNQNPYKECDIEKIKRDDVQLIRRRSGGGAVFHDLGNLNFTIISLISENVIDENIKFIIENLNDMGVKTEFNGRNDIYYKDRKVSGNAFFENEKIFCHHGTLLIDVDIERLSSYLTVSKLKLESKAIDSVKSRVLNLNKINGNINIEKTIITFAKKYQKKYDVEKIEYYDYEFCEKNETIMQNVEKYSSWEWNYGQSPITNLSIEEKFEWGIIDFSFSLKEGIIECAKISTDSIINDNFIKLEKALFNIEFKREIIINNINKYIDSIKIRADLITMIEKI